MPSELPFLSVSWFSFVSRVVFTVYVEVTYEFPSPIFNLRTLLRFVETAFTKLLSVPDRVSVPLFKLPLISRAASEVNKSSIVSVFFTVTV